MSRPGHDPIFPPARVFRDRFRPERSIAVAYSRGERGEGRIGLLIALAVLGSGIFLGLKIIPVRIDAYEFRDYIREECRFGAARKDEAEVTRRILRKAKELEIPLDKKNLVVERTEKEMIVSAKYEQPIDLKVTTYVFRFDHKERAPMW